MNENKFKHGKKYYIITLVLFVVFTIFGTTYAWKDFSQHKTNEFRGNITEHNATLIEEFEPVHEWDINSNAQIKKEVKVKNSGKKDLYVRVRFHEYMEQSGVAVTETVERYMIDSNGDFITFPTLGDANTAYPGHVAVELTNVFDLAPSALWYIQTKAGDVNGQYGRYVSTIPNGLNPNLLNMTPVISGTVNASADASTKHSDASNGEDKYPIHGFIPATNPTAEIGAFVQLDLPNGAIGSPQAPVQLLSTWNGTPGNFWVVDDLSNDGWMYWGNVMKPADITSLALETVTLIQEPATAFYYALHANMEAISHEDIGLWTNAPVEILDMVDATK